MEEAEIKGATAAKSLENGGVDGENAKGVATSETTEPTTALDSTTPLLLSVHFLDLIVNVRFLVFS